MNKFTDCLQKFRTTTFSGNPDSAHKQTEYSPGAGHTQILWPGLKLKLGHPLQVLPVAAFSNSEGHKTIV